MQAHPLAPVLTKTMKQIPEAQIMVDVASDA